jgi:hypothetical protein
MGAVISMDILYTGELTFVKDGTQKITDAMVDKLDGKVMKGAWSSKLKNIMAL